MACDAPSAGRMHAFGWPSVEPLDDFLDGDDRAARGQDRLFLHADDALDQHVAVAVRPLRVNDRHVGPERRNGRQRLAGERAHDRCGNCGFTSARPPGAPRNIANGRLRGAGVVGAGHRGVAVFLERERPRPAVLDRVAQPVQRPDAGVAAPREDERRGAAGADQLIVDQVRGHAHEREVAAALADDLVPGRERDQVREALHRDDVAVVHRVL